MNEILQVVRDALNADAQQKKARAARRHEDAAAVAESAAAAEAAAVAAAGALGGMMNVGHVRPAFALRMQVVCVCDTRVPCKY